MTRWMTSAQTSYGYDPGHDYTHAKAGILSDWSDDANLNSANHNKNRPGQNVAMGAGNVEWLSAATLQDNAANGDRIFLDDDLPDEIETFIVQ